MSITKTLEAPDDTPSRLARAWSWHYPNRECSSSPIHQNYRRKQRFHADAVRKPDPQLGSINEKEKRRMRLIRQQSLTPAKFSTKENILIPSSFDENEEIHNELNNRKQVFGISHDDTSRMASKASISEQYLMAHQEVGSPDIPGGLTTGTESEDDNDERIYQKLIQLVYNRGKEGKDPPEVIVITDIAKDYDDLTAMIVLKELHRLGLIKLIGFVANMNPAQKRAEFARGCLDDLGLQNIPVSWGTGAKDVANKNVPDDPWEFPYEQQWFKHWQTGKLTFTDFDQPKTNQEDRNEIESGVTFLTRTIKARANLRRVDPRIPKFTFLLISGLRDIAEIAQREPETLAEVTSNVVLQGNYTLERGHNTHRILKADLGAANNSFDKDASERFHQFMDEHHIPSVVFTRNAAFAVKQDAELFVKLRETGHPLGFNLEHVLKVQETKYYEMACSEDPSKRFSADRDQDWYLKGKTNWFDKFPAVSDHPAGTPGTSSMSKPVGEEVIPYVMLVMYDVLAALGTAGQDVLEGLELLDPPNLFEAQDPSIHKIVGEHVAGEAIDARPMMNVKNTQAAIRALLKGSLECRSQKIPSVHSSWALWQYRNQLEPGVQDPVGAGFGTAVGGLH